MIGILTKENIYTLMIEISSKKNSNVYWYKDNNLELGIEKLKEKNCNIIITNQDYSNINDNSIKFISLNIASNNNEYILDSEELLNAINNHNEQEVLNILQNLDIPNDKDILITNTNIVLIKHLVEEIFPNKVKTINDIILNEIPESNEDGEIYLIN